jgi:hypothetical protein
MASDSVRLRRQHFQLRSLGQTSAILVASISASSRMARIDSDVTASHSMDCTK